jgi:hypothetical protein
MLGEKKTRWPTIDDKADRLLAAKKVKLVADTTNAFYFDVQSLYPGGQTHDVMINKDQTSKTPYSCTNCKWFERTLKECSHIIACKKLICKAGLTI